MPVGTSQRLISMVGSSNDWVVPAECGESASNTNILGKVVEACNPGSSCKVTPKPINRDSAPPLNTRAPSIFVPTQSPSFELMGFHSDEKIDESRFSPVPPKDELSSDGVICHTLKPCDHQSGKAQLDKFEVHLSDTCQRRFVMFDQSGSKRRMIFHPSMVHEFSALLHSPLTITNCKEHTTLERTRSVGHLREVLVRPVCLDDSAYLDAIMPPVWGSTLSPSREEDTFQPLYASIAEGSSQDRDMDCLSKENTEDLDALLWSDDEMSSEGHSPSDSTWSDADSPNASNVSIVMACTNTKRKACIEVETDSTATSPDSTPSKCFCSGINHLGRGSGYGKHGFAASNLSSGDEESSNGSTNILKRHQTRSFIRKQPSKKTRKDKIHSTLQLLRGLIPGGESMDAAVVLGEAVQYVKSLQVEVQKLESIVFP